MSLINQILNFGFWHIVIFVVMLTVLLGLSFVKAGMIIAYFMHLRFDGKAFAWTLLPMWIMCTLLLLVSFPDSFELIHRGWPR